MDWLINLANRLGQQAGERKAIAFMNKPAFPESTTTRAEAFKQELPQAWNDTAGGNPALDVMSKTLFWPNTLLKATQGGVEGGWLGAIKAIGTGEAPQITKTLVERGGTANPLIYGTSSLLESGIEAATLFPGLFKMGAEIATKPYTVGQTMQEAQAILNKGRLSSVIDLTQPYAEEAYTTLSNKVPWYQVAAMRDSLRKIRIRMQGTTPLLAEEPTTSFFSGPGITPKQVGDLQGELFKERTRLQPNLVGKLAQIFGAVPKLFPGLENVPTEVVPYSSEEEMPSYGEGNRKGITLNTAPDLRASKWERILNTGAEEISHALDDLKGLYDKIYTNYVQGIYGEPGSKQAESALQKAYHESGFYDRKEQVRKAIAQRAITKQYKYFGQEDKGWLPGITTTRSPIIFENARSPFSKGAEQAKENVGFPKIIARHPTSDKQRFISVDNPAAAISAYTIKGHPIVRGVYSPDLNMFALGARMTPHYFLESKIDALHLSQRIARTSAINFYYAKPDLVASKEGWQFHHGPRERKCIFAISQKRQWKGRESDFGPLDKQEIADFEKLRKALLAKGMPGDTPFYPLVMHIKSMKEADFLISRSNSTLDNPLYEDRISVPQVMIDKDVGPDQRFKVISMAERKEKEFREGIAPAQQARAQPIKDQLVTPDGKRHRLDRRVHSSHEALAKSLGYKNSEDIIARGGLRVLIDADAGTGNLVIQGSVKSIPKIKDFLRDNFFKGDVEIEIGDHVIIESYDALLDSDFNIPSFLALAKANPFVPKPDNTWLDKIIADRKAAKKDARFDKPLPPAQQAIEPSFKEGELVHVRKKDWIEDIPGKEGHYEWNLYPARILNYTKGGKVKVQYLGKEHGFQEGIGGWAIGRYESIASLRSMSERDKLQYQLEIIPSTDKVDKMRKLFTWVKVQTRTGQPYEIKKDFLEILIGHTPFESEIFDTPVGNFQVSSIKGDKVFLQQIEELPPAPQAIEEQPSKAELDLFGNPITPPTTPTTPARERQLEFTFPSDKIQERKFREAGIGKSLADKIVYASHLGIGPEIQQLADALDKKAIAIQANQVLKQQLNKVFDKYTSWMERSKESVINKPSALKQKVFNLLENPHIDWTSSDITSLPKEIQDIMYMMYKDQMKFYWEENRIRTARGEEIYPLRHGYMMHLLEAKVKDAIRKGMPISGEILVPFGRKLNMNIFLGVAEERTDNNLEIIRDPVIAYIARRNLNDNFTIIQPVLDKAIEDFRALQASDAPPPLSVSKFFEDYVKTDVKGQITPADRALSASIALPVKLINILMSPFGRTLGPNPAKVLTQKALGAQYLGTIWGVGRLFTQNILQSIHQVGMYGPGPASKAVGAMIKGTMYGVWEAIKNIFHPFEGFQKGWLKSKVGQVTSQLSEIQHRFPAQELDANAKQLLLRAGWMPLKSSDMLNVIHAGETAYLGAKNWQADAGFQAECRRLAIADKLPEDTYLWTDQDCINEANFGIMCAQYKYTPSASPEIYRTSVGKLFGSLQSWTINYWGTFWRELIYRAYEGKTGWQTADGIHKPIPTKARAGAVMYLLTAAGIIGATAAMGFDYSKQFLFGTLPNRLSPAGSVIYGTGRYLVGLAQGNEAMMKQGLYDMKRGGQAFIPAHGAARQLERAKTEGPGAFLFYYPTKKKVVLPTRANIRRQVFKESGVPQPTKVTINKMLNL